MPMAFQLADKLAATEFVPAALRNRPAAIAAAILTGHEIGLPPMASLALIHVIEGKPGLYAAGQRSLILAHGHRIWIEEMTITRATVCGQRRGEERILTVTWTIEDARRAQLAGKQNWQKYPRNMLVARATGDCARGAFMDVLAGIPYNVEELEDGQDGGPGASDASPAQEPPRRRRAGRAATTPSLVSEPPPAPDPALDEISSESNVEPPPGPEPEAITPDASAGHPVDGERMTLAQQIAKACREAGIERADLIFAVTGKTSGRELTRDQAADILDKARAINRGEYRLDMVDGIVTLIPDEDAAPAFPVSPKEGARHTDAEGVIWEFSRGNWYEKKPDQAMDGTLPLEDSPRS
jgi:hypothetical protein